jgi:hypothetical protein
MDSKLDFLRNRKRDWQTTFATPTGERVLHDLYKMCGMNAQVFVPGDDHATAFNSGKHRIGQGIQSLLSHDEEKIMEIVKNSKIAN